MVLVEVQSLAADPGADSPVVTLGEVGGSRTLPIWIGPGEAAAIAMRLDGFQLARPLTHDLAASFVTALGGHVKEARIHRLESRMYHAEVVLERDGEALTVDARPSDAIAIALRAEAEIFVADDLLLTAERPPAAAGPS